MLYETDIVFILIILDSNLLKEILDRHQDDSVLVSLLHSHLSLFLVSDHQPSLISLNNLQLTLLFGNLIGIVKGLQVGLFFENVHVHNERIHSATTFLMT